MRCEEILRGLGAFSLKRTRLWNDVGRWTAVHLCLEKEHRKGRAMLSLEMHSDRPRQTIQEFRITLRRKIKVPMRMGPREVVEDKLVTSLSRK